MGQRKDRSKKRRSRPRSRDASTYGRVLFGGLLLTSLIALGSAHYEVANVMAASACVLFLGGGERVQSGWGLPSLLCAALALWTGTSIVPLPPQILAFLSPETAELWRSGLELAGANSSKWNPLSLDPIASTAEAAKWTGYACVAATAGSIAKSKGLNAILQIVGGCAFVVACITIVQTLLGTTRVLGVYQPISDSPMVARSVLLNPNNLAGLCNLGVFSGIGLISSRRNRLPLPALYAGTVLCAVTSFLTASRGGVAALVLGALCLLGYWSVSSLRSPNPDARRYRNTVSAAAIGIAAAGAVIVLSASSETWRQLFNDDLTKIENLGHLGPALKTHWLTGIGRGAFESVSFLYFDVSRYVVYRSVENFIGSWAIEWGAPATLLALGCLAWILRPSRLALNSSRPAQAAYVGILVLGLQNMGDLALELFSVTALVFALLGALDATRAERSPSSEGEVTRSSYLITRLAAGLGALMALGALAQGPDLFTVKRNVSKQVGRLTSRPATTFSHIRNVLLPEMTKRPAEPYFALLGAEAALTKNVDALPWAAAALERAPKSAHAHVLTALSLLQRNAAPQAMLHFREALLGDEPRMFQTVAEHVARHTRDLKLIEAAAPDNKSGALFLWRLSQKLRSSDPYLAAQLLEGASKRAPLEDKVLAARAFQLVADLGRGSFACGPEGKTCPIVDRGDWVKRIRETAARNPSSHDCADRRALSQLELLEDNLQEAFDVLEECLGCNVNNPCLEQQVRAADALNDPARTKIAENQYLTAACTSPSTCAEAELWLGTRAKAREAWLSAATHFARAASHQPKGSTWLLAARTAIRAHQLTRAELAYQEAKSLGSRDKQVEDLIRKARLKLLK